MGLLGTAMAGTMGLGDVTIVIFFSLSILRIQMVFLLAGLQYDLAPTTTT